MVRVENGKGKKGEKGESLYLQNFIMENNKYKK